MITINMRYIYAFFGLLCVSISLASGAHAKDSCVFENVSFSTDFESGRLNACEQLSDKRFLLTTEPENTPINPSPWYAFKAQTTATGETIEIVLRAHDANSRYMPKRLSKKGRWETIDFDFIDGDFVFSLALSSSPTLIAAQGIIDNQYYAKWMNEIAEAGTFAQILLGQSEQKRNINALVHKRDNKHEWIVIVGRQHPPELTGAQALLHFVNVLNHDAELLKKWTSRFNILIVPNGNPDGVAMGNWRHNANGIDLNRDWGKFTQAETRIIGEYMDTIFADCEKPCTQQKLVFAMDFHSTQQNIFYTMPNDYELAPQDFSDTWLARLKSHTVSSFVIRNRPGASPGRGVFKQYIADTYKVHAVTYEMGDNTSAQMIKHVAQASAKTLIDELLERPSESFTYKLKEKL